VTAAGLSGGGFFREHTVWKILIRGWLSQIDRRRFRVFGYHTGVNEDAATKHAATLCGRFVRGSLSIDRWRQTILGDALHVLIYPEVGMDAVSAQLAAQRLAPVQCNSWGHPDTSGFPTLDYYLSSELMEPPEAQDHYTLNAWSVCPIYRSIMNRSICRRFRPVEQTLGFALRQQSIGAASRSSSTCLSSIKSFLASRERLAIANSHSFNFRRAPMSPTCSESDLGRRSPLLAYELPTIVFSCRVGKTSVGSWPPLDNATLSWTALAGRAATRRWRACTTACPL
jgi:hypothetical protein